MNDSQNDSEPATDADRTRRDPAELDGHTLDELSDYLDAGRAPADASIDSSPSCQIALTSLERLYRLSDTLLEAQASTEPDLDESWVAGILHNISRDSRAGRTIPVTHPDPAAELAITEGTVRGLVRAAGDMVEGLLVGRCRLDGDVTTPGAPITISVDASIGWGTSIPDAADRLREAIYGILIRHTDLTIAGVDITVDDVHNPAAKGSSR
ncbi:Asp23/Gls24 family envelope stress response protein [Homoserinimonas sp. OAct 916]|uniref:Asp23/Gls24 family envelope stress response protein n=1 Tax=Homoserinimonas sp. OAct 916 TaxID=2211450 RepID=UPI0018E53C5A|nr:Asp23/Gls24 family envelope stress response protein [Homoserinimonas sp. OAct 916]